MSQKLDASLLPPWVTSNYTVFRRKASKPQEVAQLFSKIEDLSALMNIDKFHLLAGSNDMLVLYQKGTLTSDLIRYQQLEQWAFSLIDAFSKIAPAESKANN